MRIALSFLFFGLALLLGGSAALAQEQEDPHKEATLTPIRIGNEYYVPRGNMRLGPFRVHPFISLRLGADDNIYLLSNKHKKKADDCPFVTEAGARFDLAHSRQKLLVGYRILNNEYTKRGGNDNVEHMADLAGTFRFGSLFLKLADDYACLYEPTPVYFNTKARREENGGSAGLGIEKDKLYLEGACGVRSYHFEGKDYDRANNKQSLMTGILGYNVSPKTRFDLKFDSASVVYTCTNPTQNDYKSTTLSLGIHYKVSGKLLSYLYLGSTKQSVDVKNNPAQKKEFSGATTSGSLSYKISPKTSISATVLSQIQYNANVNYMFVTKGSVAVRYQWTNKTRLGLRLTYETAKPSQKIAYVTSPSSRFTGGISIRYDFSRCLAAGIDYEHMSKDTDINDYTYTSNIIYTFLTLHF